MLATGPQSTESGLGRVTIDSSVFEANEIGIHAANKILMNIRNSTFTGNTLQALWIRSYMPNILAEVIIDNSQINHNATGVLVTGFGGIASVQLTRSTLTRNGQAGILLQGTGYAYSAGNNTFFGNNPDVSGGNLQSQALK